MILLPPDPAIILLHDLRPLVGVPDGARAHAEAEAQPVVAAVDQGAGPVDGGELAAEGGAEEGGVEEWGAGEGGGEGGFG